MTAFELRKILEGVPNDTRVEVSIDKVDGFHLTREIVDWDADEQTGSVLLVICDPE